MNSTQLTPRERQVLLWFSKGKSATDVADLLEISPATVMYHYRSAAAKYGTLNRTHTVVEAIQRGDIDIG